MELLAAALENMGEEEQILGEGGRRTDAMGSGKGMGERV
jgi:hypothetical protein